MRATDVPQSAEKSAEFENKTQPNVESGADSHSRQPHFGQLGSLQTGSLQTAKLGHSAPSSHSDSGIWRMATGKRGLLKQRSIRTKLLFGVVTLTTTIVLLTTVGLVGFYRYRSLADAISTRATELPLATQMSQWAATARDSNTRICQMKAREGMIDASVLATSDLQLERSNFDQAMLELNLTLSRYRDAIGLGETNADEVFSASSDTDSVSETLIDSDIQRESVTEIATAIHEIDKSRRNPRLVAVYGQTGRNELSDMLNQLVDQTHAHLDLMHGQMAQFSDHVKGQHQFGIGLAWTALAFAILITLVMVIFFKTMVIEPFGNLVMGARLVAKGEFEHRIEMGTGDELGELGDILNAMTDRFQGSLNRIGQMYRELDEEVKIRSKEVIRNEQLAGVGFLAAGFAHEINNPMAAIAWSAEALESRLSDLMMVPEDERLLDADFTSNLQENLQRIQGEAFRCKSITEKMLNFSRMGHVQRESTEVTPLVQDVVDMVTALGKYECKNVTIQSDPDVTAYANSQEVRQVVLNLITNAMESVDADGRVDVRVRTEGKSAVIRIKDTGCGMSPEVIEHLFEPFFTRRRDGTGTGLGLSISYRIVSKHGGKLIAHSTGEGKGSEMEMRLPIEPITQDEVSTSEDEWSWQSAQVAVA